MIRGRLGGHREAILAGDGAYPTQQVRMVRYEGVEEEVRAANRRLKFLYSISQPGEPSAHA